MQEIMTSEMEPGENKNSTVKLEGCYLSADALHETLAFMREHDVVLTQVHGKKNKSFAISAEAMDSLASAWFAFRAECKSVEEAEAERVKAVEAEALAYESDELVISTHLNWEKRLFWTVSALKVHFCRVEIATADRLLELVVQAKAELDEYHATIAQARAIVEAHPEHLKVGTQTWGDGSKQWRIKAEYGDWKRPARVADSAQELLEEVKAALKDLQEQLITPAPAD